MVHSVGAIYYSVGQKVPPVCGIWMFIILFAKAHHWVCLGARWICIRTAFLFMGDWLQCYSLHTIMVSNVIFLLYTFRSGFHINVVFPPTHDACHAYLLLFDVKSCHPQSTRWRAKMAVLFALFHVLETDSVAHPASYPFGTGGKAVQARSWPLSSI
jgi:hypothetical protein